LNPEPLQSDRASCDVLRRLYFSESKSGLLPVDLNLLTYLVLRKAADHAIDDSEGTLSRRLCIERKAIQRSIARLALTGWITVNGRGIGRSKSISLNLERFPAAQPIRERVTANAKQIAAEYYAALVRVDRKHKFPKGWIQRQQPSAQRLIDRCGGDAKKARDMVAVGFNDPKLQKRVRTSLYHATLIFPQLERAYEKRIAERSEQRKNDESTTQCSEAA